MSYIYNLMLTWSKDRGKIYQMKKVAVILMLVLFSAVCSPLTVVMSPSESGSFLVTLDVCSKSGSAASVNADSPAIEESSYHSQPLAFSGYVEASNHIYHPAVISFKQERPPKA